MTAYTWIYNRRQAPVTLAIACNLNEETEKGRAPALHDGDRVSLGCKQICSALSSLGLFRAGLFLHSFSNAEHV